MTLTTPQRFKSNSGLAYIKSGRGPAIVLVHGVGLRAEAWCQQTEVLSKTHTVYAVDMPGHGESDLLQGEAVGLRDYVHAIAQWIESDIKAPVIMVGHSMGAMIAIQFAARYPDICLGALALNAVYRRTEQARVAVQQRAKSMLENPDLDRVSKPISRWFGDDPKGSDLQMADLCASWLSQASPDGYAQAYGVFSRNDGPSDEELAVINVPLSFITGDLDSNSTPEMSRKMAGSALFACFHVIKHSRHMVQLTHPEEVNVLLLEFVNRCQAKISGVQP